MSSPYLTTGEIAVVLGETTWRVRRVVDSLGHDVPRAGQYRLVPRDMVADIAAALRRPTKQETSACT